MKMEKERKKQTGPDSRKAKRKERRGSRDTYEKDMNKFFTIIYHTYTAFMMKRFRQSEVAVNCVNYNCAES